MNELTYCKSWFRAKKVPIQIWDEEKAQRAHESRQSYTVLIGEPTHPRCFIEVNSDFVGVCFLDEKLRENLTYQFQEIDAGKLFLSMATYRDFEGSSDKVLIGTSYMFDQDGKVQIHKETFNPHSLNVSNVKADVTSNYESYPDFGKYNSIVIAKRD